jgi:hypothetical protein
MRDPMPKMLRAYLETALWAETDNARPDGGDPLDDNYSIEDISPASLERARAEVAAFEEAHEEAWQHPCAPISREDGSVESLAGHDLWLTSHGHGAGFWDGDWPEPWGDKLTEAAKRFWSPTPIVGDDGQIHFE